MTSRRTDAERAVAAAVDAWGRLDILVNNAGIGGATAPTWELDVDDWRRVIDVNLTGQFLFAAPPCRRCSRTAGAGS